MKKSDRGKRAPRIYVECDISGSFCLDVNDSRHILRSLRMNISDTLLVFNGQYGEWKAKITDTSDGIATVEPFSCVREIKSMKRAMVAFGVVKPNRVCFLVEKSIELGATDFFPLITDYTNNVLKIQKIDGCIKSATEQSGRLDLAKFHPIKTLQEFLDDMDIFPASWFFCSERECNASSIFNQDLKEDCGFIIGPEGGFSEYEKEIIMQKTTRISLSRNILRSETAAISCLSVCSSQRTIDDTINRQSP